MESMFLWIVMFSGAAVLLLGVFLVSSERELKKKRAEINQLLDRLDAVPAAASGANNGAEVTGLRTKTQELLKEIATLQDDLDAAHRAIDELRAGKPAPTNDVTLAQVEQLRYANSQLDAQIEELRGKLQASEARLMGAGTVDPNSQQRQTQLENSLIELKQQFERSQARVRELESAPAPDASVNAAQQRDGTDKLEARIAQLQESLNAAAESACQTDLLRQRLGDSEKSAQELREALQQRDQELPRWREQLAASEEIKSRLLALQPVYDQLVAKQSALIDHQRAYHGELKSFAEFLSASHDGTIAPRTNSYFEPESVGEASVPTQLMLTSMAAAATQATLDAPALPTAVSAIQTNGDGAASAAEAKGGFGIFHALIALLVGGALVALFLSQSGNNPSANAAKPLPQSAPAQKPATQPATPPSEIASAPAKPAIEAPAPAKELPKKAAVTAAGVYQVTQSTRVFAAPAEYAQQVGEIEPGLKVTVVNARDGWLEIHSKNGRPPGFIRSNAAARIDG